jgi:hypothetical protein
MPLRQEYAEQVAGPECRAACVKRCQDVGSQHLIELGTPRSREDVDSWQ